jgi:hypothetical protein
MVKTKTDYEFKTPTLPYKLDASKLNQFINVCPVQFYFKYFSTIKIKETTWPNTVFGNTAHKIVENAFIDLNNKRPIKDIIKDNQEGGFEKIFFSYKKRADNTFKESRYYEEEDFLKQGLQYTTALLKFIGNHFNYDLISIINPELKYTYVYDLVEDIIVTGRIDFQVLYKNGTHEIYDLKTTTNHGQYLFVDWEHSLQGMMYEYFALRRFCTLPETFNYLVVNKDEKLIFLKSKILEEFEDAEAYFKPLSKIIRMAKKFLSIPHEKKIKLKTQSYNTCKWCNYKKECSRL